MIEVSYNVQGDLTAVFDRLSAELGERALRACGFAGAKIIRDEAIQNASGSDPAVITGTLKRSIIVKRAEERSKGNERQTYLVTVRKGDFGGEDAFYWRFVENGHRKSRKKQKGMSWKRHRSLMDREFGNSTTPAHPFMRPAYESKIGEAIEAMGKSFSASIADAMRSK